MRKLIDGILVTFLVIATIALIVQRIEIKQLKADNAELTTTIKDGRETIESMREQIKKFNKGIQEQIDWNEGFE